MKEAMKKTSIGLRAVTVMLTLTVLLSGSLVHASMEWTNSDGDNTWNNDANWADEADSTVTGVPDGDNAYIRRDGDNYADLTSNAPDVGRLLVGGNGGNQYSGSGKLVIDADLHATSWSNDSVRLGNGGGGYNGVVEQTGGFVDANDWMSIGRGSGGDHSWTISGGTLQARRGIRPGRAFGGDRGVLEIAGGSVYTGNTQAGHIQMMGADETTTGPASVVRVKGSNPTEIKIGELSDGTTEVGNFIMGMNDRDNSNILDAQIDSGGITPIQVVNGDVEFYSNAMLDVSFLDGSDRQGTWTILEWSGSVVDNSEGVTGGADALSFADGVDESVWSFDIDENNNTLSVTAIPEPSSLLLLGLAGLLLMKRRRV